MDNKRWGKRFSTIFWWCLTILPLLVILIQFIGYHLTFNSGISSASDLASYHSDSNGDFFVIFNLYLNPSFNKFNTFGMPFVRNAFLEVFNSLGISGASNLATLFGFMASVQIYHLLFDFFAWLPRLFHNWMERWCVE